MLAWIVLPIAVLCLVLLGMLQVSIRRQLA
jgi:hypothetical protein